MMVMQIALEVYRPEASNCPTILSAATPALLGELAKTFSVQVRPSKLKTEVSRFVPSELKIL